MVKLLGQVSSVFFYFIVSGVSSFSGHVNPVEVGTIYTSLCILRNAFSFKFTIWHGGGGSKEVSP